MGHWCLDVAPTDEQALILTLGCTDAARELRRLGYATSAVRGVAPLLSSDTEPHARVVLLNRGALGKDAVHRTITELRATRPLVDVVVWGHHATAAFVRDALRAGARDVLLSASAATVAAAVSEIVDGQQLLPRAVRLGAEEDTPRSFEGMLTRSAAMWDVFDMASRVAPTDAAVLLLGETGTGKELLARAIHRRSGRNGRFVAVNCAAVAEELIDSELFGHVEGAFTGALHAKEGLMRYAESGTLMLDEVGNIKLAGQHRLLRALQEGAIRPVGAHQEVPIDVRFIAATSARLEDEVRAGRFREDLFFRLDVIRLEIPPLRKRPEDIIYLFAHFARRLSAQYNLERSSTAPDFLDALVDYEWPGNVRQLENVTERLLLTSPGRRLTAARLRKALPFKRGAAQRRRSSPAPEIDVDKPLRAALAPVVDGLERDYLVACLRQTRGRVGEAAEHAGIDRRTLLRKLKHHGIDKRSFRAANTTGSALDEP